MLFPEEKWMMIRKIGTRALRMIRVPVILLSFALLASRTMEANQESAIKAWVATHSTSLPSTLQELAAYPSAYRSPIFTALSATTQSQIAQAQLQSFLNSRPVLTTAQSAFVAMLQ